MRSRRVSRTVAAIAVAAAVIGPAALSASAAAARPGATNTPRVSANGWTQLSTGKVDLIENIGLARFGSSLQAVWVQETAGDTETLYTRTVAGSGTPSSSAVAVGSGWSTLNNFPVVFAHDDQRVIAFSGIQNTDTQNPYSRGYEYYYTSSDGSSWTLASDALASGSSAYGSYGTAVALDLPGTPTIAYTAGSASSISYHAGFLGAIPLTSSGDKSTSAAPKCCTYDTGLGFDESTNQMWAVWYSNSGLATTDGILAQPIEPDLGAQVQAPQSTAVSQGSNVSQSPGQSIVTAERVGGGVYAAYVIGYPSPKKVALWQLGSTNPIVIGAGGTVERVGTAAGPDGRVWVYWRNASSHTIQVARTDPSASRLGAVCSVATPGKTDSVWDLVGDAAGGPLQLFTLAGTNPQVFDTVVQPCLGVSISPASIGGARGGSFTVKVTDAGSAIEGAKVTVGGQHKATNTSGKATFSVAAHHRPGRVTVAVSKPGYQMATASVRVH